MGVKPIFIVFPWCMTWSSSLASYRMSTMGVKPIFICFLWCIPWSSSSLNKHVANWQRDISHIFLLIHGDYLFSLSWWWDNSDLFLSKQVERQINVSGLSAHKQWLPLHHNQSSCVGMSQWRLRDKRTMATSCRHAWSWSPCLA
jgi:hypothetical protein